MADLDFKISINATRTLNALDRMTEFVRSITPEAVDMCAMETQNEARRKVWAKSHAAGTPTPSAPGTPPAKITGALGRSISKTDAKEVGHDKWSAQVGPTNPPVYGRVQELGRVGTGHWPNTRMPERPYLKPTVEELRGLGVYTDIFKHAWGQAVHDAL